jgi:prephenate dehydrogenase
MNTSSITIIGAAGRMGKWFKRFFEAAGHRVSCAEGREIEDMGRVARDSDVVVVSVPISEACKVIEAVGPYVRTESLLMDLTSLKVGPAECMLRHSQSEVIGVHPLFGPDAESIQGQTIILCPLRANKWLPWLTDILSGHGARLEFISPERHDRIMAIVQAMGHVGTMLMGLMLKELNENLAALERYCTPLFRVQLALVGRLFNDNPKLYAEMITQNPEVKRPLAVYESLLEQMKRWVDEGQPDSIAQALSDASSFFDPAEAASLTASKALIQTVTDVAKKSPVRGP